MKLQQPKKQVVMSGPKRDANSRAASRGNRNGQVFSSNELKPLVISPRQVERTIPLAAMNELEDLALGMHRDSELLSIDYASPPGRRVTRSGGRFERMFGVGIERSTAFKTQPLEQDYDLLFMIVLSPRAIKYLDQVPNWRKRCKKAVCWIVEVWANEIDKYRAELQHLREFDLICTGLHDSVEPLQRATGVETFFQAPGIDALAFSPYPNPPERSIDIYQMGRRSNKTHRSFQEWAKRNRAYYLYDTTGGCHLRNSQDHRQLLADTLMRTKYFVANKAKPDRPDQTQGQQVFGFRFFEGAAGGTVMVGDIPECPEFRNYFHWDDAVIQLDWNSTDGGRLIDELNAQPERIQRIREDNVRYTLLEHDFVYRWEEILKRCGYPNSKEMQQRKDHLNSLASLI